MGFPKIFITGELDENRSERELCMDFYEGWLRSMIGTDKEPEKFKQGVDAISKKLGVPATLDSIKKYATDKGFIEN